jgi:glycosyltransferase involved in cell wall biosynthesis
MTGGLQEQITDGESWFGVPLHPSSKAIIGSQDVPFIYEDRLDGKQVTDALLKMYNMNKEERNELGRKGREHVMNNYNFEGHKEKWIDLMTHVHEKYGSWDTRKNYNSWELSEV